MIYGIVKSCKPACVRVAKTSREARVLKRVQSISLAIALCLFWAVAVQAQPMRFSPAEKAWLNEHQRLRVGVVAHTPPIMFFSDKDNPQGLVADYMRALAQHLGLQLEITRFADAASLMRALNKGGVDVIGAAVPGDEGQGLLIYTRPYLNQRAIGAGRWSRCIAQQDRLGRRGWRLGKGVAADGTEYPDTPTAESRAGVAERRQ